MLYLYVCDVEVWVYGVLCILWRTTFVLVYSLLPGYLF